MNDHEMMRLIERVLDDAKTAILATVDAEGYPHMRWMTPTVVRGRPGAIFAVTSADFPKVAQLRENPDVEWMIQTRSLSEVVNVRGRINVVDNPSLKSEVLEAVGRRLTVFWRACDAETDCVVLETIIESASHFEPMRNERQTVRFTPGGEGR